MASFAQMLVACVVQLAAAGKVHGHIRGASLRVDADPPTFNVLLTGYGPFMDIKQNPSAMVAEALGRQGVSVIGPDLGDRPSPMGARWLWDHGAAGGMSPVLTPAHVAGLRIQWHNHTLPVNRTGAEWPVQHLRAQAAGARAPYDAVIHMGVDPSDRQGGFQIETAAKNVLGSIYHGKNIDKQHVEKHPSLKIIRDGPWVLPTTVNLGRMALTNLAGTGPDGADSEPRSPIEEWGNDPGSFFCNEVYYRTLFYVRSELVGNGRALLPTVFVHVDPSNDDAAIKTTRENIETITAHILMASYVPPSEEPRSGPSPKPPSSPVPIGS